jgi:hypothetical protein
MAFNVKRKNFENIVHYNSPKLRLIQRGWDPYKVFTTAERRRLINEGILVNGNEMNEAFLSEEAMELLNEIYKNQL